MSLQPPLKWPGGKRWLASTLRGMYGPHRGFRRLVEPFVGGMSIALACNPEIALLNDLNADLMNFYRHLAGGLVPERHVQPFENSEAFYYMHRARFNALRKSEQGNTVEAAALFYWLNRTGFNGLVRYNSDDEYNVPYGFYKRPMLLRSLLHYRIAVLMHRRWEFSCADFADVRLEPDDFVYADPPYDSVFAGYTVQGFSWSDQERLAWWLVEHPGPVVASNNATPRVMRLYQSLGFETQMMAGRKASIALTAPTRPTEMLAARGIVLPQRRLF